MMLALKTCAPQRGRKERGRLLPGRTEFGLPSGATSAMRTTALFPLG